MGISYPSRFFLFVFGCEGLVGVVAAIWIQMRGLSVGSGEISTGVGLGLGVAMLLTIANYALLHLAPPVKPVRTIRRLYRETLRPLFATVGPFEIAGLSLVAGVSEELMFRGVVQNELGLVVASVLFGFVHISGRDSIIFGVWVTLMGFGLGGLAYVTGGLIAPMMAHVAYDAVAISYTRWSIDEV